MAEALLAMLDQSTFKRPKRKRKRAAKEPRRSRPLRRAAVSVPIEKPLGRVLRECNALCYRMRPDELPRIAVVRCDYGLGVVDSACKWAGVERQVSLSHLDGPLTDTLDAHRGEVAVYSDITAHHVEGLCAFFDDDATARAVLLVEDPYEYAFSPLRRIHGAKVLTPPKATNAQVAKCVNAAKRAWVPPGAAFAFKRYLDRRDPEAAVRAVHFDYVTMLGRFPDTFDSARDPTCDGPAKQAEEGRWHTRDVVDYVATVLPSATPDILELAERCDDVSAAAVGCPPEEAAWVAGLTLRRGLPNVQTRYGAYYAELTARGKRNPKRRRFSEELGRAADHPECLGVLRPLMGRRS